MKLFYFCMFFFGVSGLFAQSYIQTLQDAVGADFVQPSVVSYPYDGPDNYIVAGTLVDTYGDSQIMVVKISDNGTTLWSKYISSIQGSFVGSLLVDKNENIVLIGYEGDNQASNKDLRVLKLDGQGNFLAEVLISDADLNYGLYGLDIEQTKSGDYLIVGVGFRGDAETSSKFGYVLRLQEDLLGIQWGKKYQSDATTYKYDAFNHILKVTESFAYEDIYLLTGSGTTSDEEMMAANDLINSSGNSLWNGAVGHRFSVDDYINPGRMALYQKATHDFYVQSYGAENMPAIIRLDNNGNGYGPVVLHNHSWGSKPDNINLINGMRWETDQQDKIILSGYHIQPSIPPGQAWPMLINVALSNNNTTYWVKYSSFF